MISKIRNSFAFVGTLAIAKDKDKKEVGLTEVPSKNSSWKGLNYALTINNGDGLGVQRLKFFGGDNVKGSKFADKEFKDGDKSFKVSYDNRFDEEVLKKVRNFYKRKVVLDGVTHEFIYQNDFIEFISKNKDNIVGKKFKVTGEFNTSYVKGNTYKEFVVTSLEEVQEDTKTQSKTQIQIFYTKDCIDRNLLDNNKLNIQYLNDLGNKIKIQAFLENRNTDKTLGIDSIFFPIEVMLDMSKLDFTNDKHLRMAHLMINNFNINTSGVYSSAWDASLINASEQVHYSEADLESLLTPEEREYAQLFGKDLNEVLAKKQGTAVWGERVNEVRIYQPNITLPIKTQMEQVTVDMLELYKSLSQKEDVIEEQPKAEVKKDISSNEFEELFG